MQAFFDKIFNTVRGRRGKGDFDWREQRGVGNGTEEAGGRAGRAAECGARQLGACGNNGVADGGAEEQR